MSENESERDLFWRITERMVELTERIDNSLLSIPVYSLSWRQRRAVLGWTAVAYPWIGLAIISRTVPTDVQLGTQASQAVVLASLLWSAVAWERFRPLTNSVMGLLDLLDQIDRFLGRLLYKLVDNPEGGAE